MTKQKTLTAESRAAYMAFSGYVKEIAGVLHGIADEVRSLEKDSPDYMTYRLQLALESAKNEITDWRDRLDGLVARFGVGL